MNFRNTTLLLLILSCAGTGCSRFRGLTRHDYALSKDPFAGDLSADSLSESGMTPSSTGVVSVGNLEGGAERTAVADYGSVDAANAARAQTGVNDGAPLGENPFAQVSYERSEGAEPEKAETVDQAVIDDFAAYAAQRSSEWRQEVTTANQVFEETKTAAADAVRTQQASVEKLIDDMPALEFETRTADVAEPLLKNTPTAQAQGKAEHWTATPPKKSSPSPNPFEEIERTQQDRPVPAPDFDDSLADENPFAAAASKKTQQNSGGETQPETLDAEFKFDTGWRPSEVMRP